MLRLTEQLWLANSCKYIARNYFWFMCLFKHELVAFGRINNNNGRSMHIAQTKNVTGQPCTIYRR